MSHSLDSAKTKPDTILVVDDSPDNVLLVQSILEEEGYHIEVAEEGESAIAQVNANPPQLILLDVMMPGMDGFEVTERIRQQEELPFIPILLITAYDQPSVAKGLDSGADDFIRKPVELEELLARVRSLLRLKHSVDERDEIARQRADFVSRLTHDLRTPLVAADRMLNLFQQGALGELSPPMKEAVETMTRSNRNLLDMVNTLLEVYRFEAGRKVLNFTTVDLTEIIGEVIQELNPLAEEKGLSLKKQEKVEDEQLTQLEGDRLELRRVFTNLVGNAIKFTDEGQVEVRIKQQVKTDAPEFVIEVEDTGPGVALEEQKSLFERFRKGKRRNSGSGLGLHLSQRILESHNGSISLDSEEGKGSVFTVKLPIKQG